MHSIACDLDLILIWRFELELELNNVSIEPTISLIKAGSRPGPVHFIGWAKFSLSKRARRSRFAPRRRCCANSIVPRRWAEPPRDEIRRGMAAPVSCCLLLLLLPLTSSLVLPSSFLFPDPRRRIRGVEAQIGRFLVRSLFRSPDPDAGVMRSRLRCLFRCRLG